MESEQESDVEFESNDTRGEDSKKRTKTCSSDSNQSTRDGEVFLV